MDTQFRILAGYLPEKEMARELGVTTRTFRRWRQLQIGPPHATAGREVIYSIETTRAWLQAGGTSGTSAKRGRNAR